MSDEGFTEAQSAPLTGRHGDELGLGETGETSGVSSASMPAAAVGEDYSRLITLITLGAGAVFNAIVGFLLISFAKKPAACVAGILQWATIYGAVVLGLSVATALGLAVVAFDYAHTVTLDFFGLVSSAVSVALLGWGSSVLFGADLWNTVVILPHKTDNTLPCDHAIYLRIAITTIIAWIVSGE